ncbi:SusC/RagA family TonB-linked outer membrane protein [Paludibacter sp. 221]|uniref:SusC/RagA family TonB-linked outer membrane protein n=1 Tax=Paludibacter sp. 221 TaxID=2302939 RepID=UPI0013D57C91|nr:SusC/RagA family TonB-linked outer membrane protein [Paludibacter sp. 221]NDV45914.1 SusC/RagA family TonB-linked outer membrane protein [Paludibacter sp. 221]
MRRLTLLLACFFLVGIGLSYAQSRSISGKILSAENEEPIIGATILLKGTSTGTITDVDGEFSITVPNTSSVLVVSFIGMKQVEVPASNNMVVKLENDAKVLDEVVVTALGISKEKKALGYAVQEVNSEQLNQAGNTNLSSALQGKVSGVEIIPSSGMPGASSKITIRGSRSFTGDNTPLYIVDGMPINSTADISTLNSVTGTDYSTRALDIDPSDIESINILKGQAASALYGMRASNGVVVITTKSGKGARKDKATVTINSNVSFDVISTLPKFQTEFAQGSRDKNGKLVYDPNSSLSWGPKISELPNDPNYGGNTVNDYTNEYGMKEGYYYVPKRAAAGLDGWALPQSYNNAKDFFQTGITWSNSVNVAKGLEKGSFSLSLGSTNTEGIIPNTGMNRYNAKFTTELQLSKHFSTGVTGNFVSTNISKQTGANDGIVATVYGAPASYDMAGIPAHIEGDPYRQNNFRGGAFDAAYWAIENNKFTEQTQRFFGNAFLNYATTFSNNSKLNLKYQLGTDSYSTDYRDMFGYGHSGGQGEVEHYVVTRSELNSLFVATYNWIINDDLVLDLLYGNELIQSKRLYTQASGRNFMFSGWNHMSNALVYVGDEATRNKRTFGNFGNISLAYKNMLYLNATVRNDLVSNMPRNNRSFTYPSVSLGWIFTELDALSNNVLTFGKLRASYAQVGQAGDYYESYYTTPIYSGGFSSGYPLTYPFGNVKAFTPYPYLYDPNLKPQNTTSYEIGADLTFWNGLMYLNYTFSRQNAKDQIFDIPLAGSTGYEYLVTNGGSIHTNAHEVTLGFNPINNKNFKWDFAFNFTKIDNYVDELAPGVESIFLGGFVEPQVRAGIGYKFPVIYGISYLRNDEGQIIVDDDGLPMPGKEEVLGDVSPDFRLGFNTSFEIYKFKLSAVFDWKQGGVIYAATPGLLDYYGVSQKTADFRKMESFLFEQDAVKIVGTDGDGNTTYAPNDIYISGDDASAYFSRLNDISESMVVENSFIKLREIALSYPVWDKSNLSINLSAFARNLILWSTLEGLDPEVSQGNTNMSGAFERFSLPGTASFGFGISVKF